MKKHFKNFIIKILGRKRIEFIRSRPFFVHGKYRGIIQDVENYSLIIENSFDKNPELSILLIRKFAHILDKGLHRSDVGPGHSGIIAKELENNLNVLLKSNKELYLRDTTVLWAIEKLAIYNKLQRDGEIIELKDKRETPLFDFDLFFELIKSRRSNRQFSDKLLSDELITKLAQTVNWAPSSCNKQPVKLFVTNNPLMAKECLKQCKGGTGFSEHIPCFVAFCADMRGYYLPDEMFLPAIDVSLGAENFFIALNCFGISGTALSWALKDRNEELILREILNIPEGFQIIFNAVIGYAEKSYLQPIRKEINQTVNIVN